MMSEERKIQRFNLDEGRIWEAIEGLSPFKTTYTLEEVCEKLNEQQAIIQSLQDLCGKSDYENAKLRLKNKEQAEEIKLLKPTNVEQYEQIVQLQEENEQLRQDRDNWKNISCQDINKWSIFSNEVNILQETRDVDRFLEKYYKYCEDMIKEE